MNQSCIFCRIINKEIPSKFIAENEYCIVINDIAPRAPIHYLIIPKKHIANLHAAEPSDAQLLGQVLLMAQEVAQTLPEPKAFQLVFNNGQQAGQSVFHLHAHLISGKFFSGL
jgi:histidine triad (HIT) family protein